MLLFVATIKNNTNYLIANIKLTVPSTPYYDHSCGLEIIKKLEAWKQTLIQM